MWPAGLSVLSRVGTVGESGFALEPEVKSERRQGRGGWLCMCSRVSAVPDLLVIEKGSMSLPFVDSPPARTGLAATRRLSIAVFDFQAFSGVQETRNQTVPVAKVTFCIRVGGVKGDKWVMATDLVRDGHLVQVGPLRPEFPC